MRLLVWNDGQVVEASQFRLERPYVMQRIHTLGHRVYNISRHIELLREGSIELFGFATLCGPADAERIIVKLLELSRVTQQLSCPVAMRIDCDGALSFEVESPIYDTGMSLKSKRMVGIEIVIPAPDVESQTSATIVADSMYEAMAIKRGGNTAIAVDVKGNIHSLPWRPIFVVYGGRVYTPNELHTVEYLSAKSAIESLGMELVVCNIPFISLQQVDEVFLVDVMSVWSLSTIKKHRLLSVVTSRITSRMEPRF